MNKFPTTAPGSPEPGPRRLRLVMGQAPSPLAWLDRVAEGSLVELPQAGLMRRLDRDLRRLIRQGPPAGGPGHLKLKQTLAPLYGGLDVPSSVGGAGYGTLVQVQTQFQLGYHDLDLRDAAGVGHGRIVVLHGTPEVRERWANPLIKEGKLPGLLATEPTGGTAIRNLQTEMRRGCGGWVLDGTKKWVSRIQEADVFTVFAQDPAGELIAAIVPAHRVGISVEPLKPAGLGGWSWGLIRFNRVEIAEEEVLYDARRVWESHFNYYRPLVGATALGGAAAMWDLAAAITRQRQTDGRIARPRDTTLEILGETEHALRCAFLGVIAAAVAVERNTPTATVIARSAKAGAVETGRAAVDQLSWLFGAAGFEADSRVAKIARDIAAYRFADGHNRELNRSTGRELLQAIPSGNATTKLRAITYRTGPLEGEQ